eukprot:jgi/Ulvmu1/12731/UM095_0035.1
MSDRSRLYRSHVPLPLPAKMVLSVGSALGALMYPQRADLVAAVGELTGSEGLRGMYNRMLHDNTGLKILSEKPVITDEFLSSCEAAPEGSFGSEYHNFMRQRGFRADERPPVRFVDDAELAYVATRYRQIHDFWHVIFACDTNLLGETALKALEFTQTQLPMTAASVAAGYARLKPQKRQLLTSQLVPWATRAGLKCTDLMTIYYENHVNDDLQQLRHTWKVTLAPPEIAA